MTKTITFVSPTPRKWGPKYPDSCSVQGAFDDGSRWEVATKDDKAQSRIDTLTAFIDKPTDFELVAKPDYNGVAQWDMKSWPGKTQFGGGGGAGGGKAYTPRFQDTELGWLATQRSIYRSVALQQAIVEYGVCMTNKSTQFLIHDAASRHYDWLCEGLPAAKTSVGVQTPTQEGQNATEGHQGPREALRAGYEEGIGNAVPGGANAGQVNNGPGQCSYCNAPEGAKHTKTCQI